MMMTTAREHIESAAEWIQLPELVVPTISAPTVQGSVYTVHKVGFVVATNDELRRLELSSPVAMGGRPILPTAVVQFADERQLCRLPTELVAWARDAVANAQSGLLRFPMQVEFGRLKGRVYAELL
jgi:hypothetical protein